MITELIKNKVYYKIFDRSYKNLTHSDNIHDFDDQIEKDRVKNNIGKVLSDFDTKNILLLNQVHGNNVVCTEELDIKLNNWPEGDASVSTQQNMILAIRTADCVPLLFASSDGSVIGAAHCGWRSAKLDIVAKLAHKMRHKGARDIVAVIGPAIAQESYEVSKDFYEDFVADSSSYKTLFLPSIKTNHYLFDLPSFVKIKLARENIRIIKHINENTYMMPTKYPSYRRSTHTGEIHNQNILSAITRVNHKLCVNSIFYFPINHI